MCIMVWMGSEQPVTPVEKCREPRPDTAWYYVQGTAPEAPIRQRLASPHVTYVGSHQGCGCGFNSGALAWEGFARAVEVTPYLDAMTTDERDAYQAELASRARLQALVTVARQHGPVQVYACWSGDETMPPCGDETVEPAWLTEFTAPLEERVRYTIPAVCLQCEGAPGADDGV